MVAATCRSVSTKLWREVVSERCVLLGSRVCSRGYFKCIYLFDCVPMSRVMDGVPDCFDKSDEVNQSTKSFFLIKSFVY